MTHMLMILLLTFLVGCAIAVSFSKDLLQSILIYMSYSLIMSVIWVLLESPDLAVTEAAVGAGITSILFFVTLKKINSMKTDKPTSLIMTDDGTTDNTVFLEETEEVEAHE